MFKTKKFVAVVAMCMVALLAFSACGGEKKEASASGESESSSASASSKTQAAAKLRRQIPPATSSTTSTKTAKAFILKNLSEKENRLCFQQKSKASL